MKLLSTEELKFSPAFTAAALFAAWFILFIPVSRDLWHTWLNDENNSHGILVPLICLYFIWRKKEDLQAVPYSSSWWGGLVLGISLLIYVVSFAGDLAFVARLMMVASLMGLIIYNYGKDFFKVVIFPVSFLVFMIPIPASVIQLISLPLKFFATTISAAVIRMFSIPVLQEGNMLYFAQTQLEVADACSGLNSIVALTMLSVIFAYLTKKGIPAKIILLASAIPLALFVNIVRVSGTGILAHYFGDGVAQGFFHEFSGMAIFFAGFLILLLEFILIENLGRSEKL
ncbi:MAG: exosortase/archaeosortase family protein [Desulfobulbaceae bacterium]|nr:exosortase/archaeosortase family protein [Desulfobulbaceae bacterium]